MRGSFSIKNTIRGPVPRLPFELMAAEVLGPRYELSLVICGDALVQKMNRQYRLPSLKLRHGKQKNYTPNVLSFPLTKTEGEVFLNVRKAEREARKYGCSTKERVALLFVHGLLHLKGLPHGRTMESTEQRILRQFGVQK